MEWNLLSAAAESSLLAVTMMVWYPYYFLCKIPITAAAAVVPTYLGYLHIQPLPIFFANHLGDCRS